MSDVAKKTQPPGSWPGSKGGRATEDASQAGQDARSAPRSVAAPSSAAKDGAGEFEEGQSGHYTHERDEPLQNIREESSTGGMKHVEPQPMSNGFTENDQDEVGDEVPVTEGGAQDAAKTADDAEIPQQDAGSNLTSRAKEAFDLASRDQPTDGARDAFLQSAASRTNQQSQQPEGIDEQTVGPEDSITEHTPQDGEEVPTELREPQGTEQQGEVQTELQEQQPGSEQQGEVPTEFQDHQGTEQQQEVPETQAGEEEQLPTELQEQPQTEGANLEGSLPPTDEFPLDFSALKNGTVNKGGNIINEEGKLVGRVTEGVLAHLIGKRSDENGIIWDDRGQQVGKAEPLSDKQREEMLREASPFESFLDNTIDSNGMVVSGGEFVGKVVEGDLPKLRGKSCDADGEVLDNAGNVIGRCERWEPEPEEEPEPEPEVETDLSALAGGTITKLGYVVNSHNQVVGRVVEGDIASLVNKRVDENGIIWDDRGQQLGRCELLPDNEREDLEKDSGPFSSFPDAIVATDGWVTNGEGGETIGKVVEGDVKALRNKSVEADGSIIDKVGRTLGRAERWEAEAEPEPEAVDYSSLAGKRVNKAGWLVDGNGQIFGRVVQGDIKNLVGRMANKNGEILSESGDVIGKAELVSEGEREGLKEGPFAELSGLTVAKDGTVVTPSGDIVGRLVEGDAKKLVGRPVDEDGDILDRNGNKIGKAERWEPEEVEKTKSLLAGRRVNKKGEVVDADGNLIGKLTSGNLQICSGKEIDDDGDVVDGKGTVIGHVSLLDDIPDEETETADEKTAREQAEVDKKLAIQLSVCIEQCLDRVKPLCKVITEKIDDAERKRGNDEEVDEDKLVSETRPLLEEANRVLNEAHGMIKGLDPDGRLSAGAKGRAATGEATPEQHRLANALTELTKTVEDTLANAKKKLENFPRAKKQLSPLLLLLREPLGQIIAGVGLLLNGVLSIVGRLLNGLGLGGLLDGLLGTLGLNRLLDNVLGIGGDKKKKSGGGGGLLGGLLGGGK